MAEITQSFDTGYPSHPFADMDTILKTYQHDDLAILRPIMDFVDKRNVFGQFIPHQFDVRATPIDRSMIFSGFVHPHANFDAIAQRTQWLPSASVDTYSQEIFYKKYGAKMAFHEDDAFGTYFKANGKNGVKWMVENGLGSILMGVLHMLQRNAFLLGAVSGENGAGYALYGAAGTGADFSDIASTDRFTSDYLLSMGEGLNLRNIDYMSPEAFDVLITSPVVPGQLRRETGTVGQNQYIPIMSQADPASLGMRGIRGRYLNAQIIESNACVLWNCGPVLYQHSVTAPINERDGVDPNLKVDGVWRMGQYASATSVKNYIQLDSVEGLAANQIVTIDAVRTNAYGVENGVDFNSGTAQNRQIIHVDTANKRIVLDRPILEPFATDLGGGVYAYVTLGETVHASILLRDTFSVVAAVNYAPTPVWPPSIDDLMGIYRFAWKSLMAYQAFNPKGYEVAFTGGQTRMKGPLA